MNEMNDSYEVGNEGSTYIMIFSLISNILSIIGSLFIILIYIFLKEV